MAEVTDLVISRKGRDNDADTLFPTTTAPVNRYTAVLQDILSKSLERLRSMTNYSLHLGFEGNGILVFYFFFGRFTR